MYTIRPEVYHPIACLNTMYKLYTTSLMVSSTPRSMGSYPQSKKHSARVRQVAMTRSHFGDMQGEHLSMAWIDYSKAFDSVPHQDMLRMMRVPRIVCEAIGGLMGRWRPSFNISKSVWTKPIQYHKGLFQGDALSPCCFA